MGRVSVTGIEPVNSGCFQDLLQVGTALKMKERGSSPIANVERKGDDRQNDTRGGNGGGAWVMGLMHS